MGNRIVFTDLTDDDVCFMLIDGQRFEIISATASWAPNEIPMATVELAIGTSMRTRARAAIHVVGNRLERMQKAQIYFMPKGQRTATENWTGSSGLFFDGYYVGMTPNIGTDNVTVTCHLVHWSIDLNASSAMSAGLNTASTASLGFSSLAKLQPGSGRSDYDPNFLSALAGFKGTSTTVAEDVWSAAKDILTLIARDNRMSTTLIGSACSGGFGANNAALAAFAKIAGGKLSPVAHDAYKPIRLDGVNNVPEIIETISVALTGESSMSLFSSTMWEYIVNYLCAKYSMAFVPFIEHAIMVAYCPALRTVYKELLPDDGTLLAGPIPRERPLYGVTILGEANMPANSTGTSAPATGKASVLGGCFVPDGAQVTDGGVYYAQAPFWLANTLRNAPWGGYTTGVRDNKPSVTSTSPESMPKPPLRPLDELAEDLGPVYKNYAQALYVAHTTAGGMQSYAGRLRFDVAPLSIVKVLADPKDDPEAPGVDALATDLVASVARVTISLHCEQGLAGTAFQLSHVRTNSENASDRCSVASHPLYGANIYNGAPLSTKFGG